jgi:mannose-6-phosphate isomerase-like protein (cupin superfamily)
MELDGETATLVSGDSVAILPDQVHRIRNASNQNLVILAICVPAWTPDNSVYLD